MLSTICGQIALNVLYKVRLPGAEPGGTSDVQ